MLSIFVLIQYILLSAILMIKLKLFFIIDSKRIEETSINTLQRVRQSF